MSDEKVHPPVPYERHVFVCTRGKTCATGPMIVVYPENIWYAGVTLDDVDEILEKTVMRGEIIERLLHK